MFSSHIMFILYATFLNKLTDQATDSSSGKVEKFRGGCVLTGLKSIKMEINCATHWPSTYNMLDHAIYLQPVINSFIDSHPKHQDLKLTPIE